MGRDLEKQREAKRRYYERNREVYLAGRSTAGLVRLLSETAENWLQPDYPFRQFALKDGPKATGFSEATLATGLDAFSNS